MINTVFNKDGRLVGFGTKSIQTDNREVIEVSESELNELIPEDFEGDWRDNRQYFKLEDGEIVFDEDYTPPEETGE